jgi:hypothetical protein
MDSNDKTNSKESLNNLKEEIEIAHSKQKIKEIQFNLLNKEFSFRKISKHRVTVYMLFHRLVHKIVNAKD